MNRMMIGLLTMLLAGCGAEQGSGGGSGASGGPVYRLVDREAGASLGKGPLEEVVELSGVPPQATELVGGPEPGATIQGCGFVGLGELIDLILSIDDLGRDGRDLEEAVGTELTWDAVPERCQQLIVEAVFDSHRRR